MAKSIRSKWKRKCRAVKRERYGKKELDRLKKTLGISDSQLKDEEMKDIKEIVKVTDAKTIKEKAIKVNDDVQMDTGCSKRIFNSKTLRDQHGSYPVWLHPRKIPRKSKKSKKGKAKK